MRSIYKIALVELQLLFYSPIAWIILTIFTLQCSLIYIPIFEGYVKNQEMGYPIWDATSQTFSGMRGFFTNIQHYIYLYIPIITMSLLSREYSSGSIKLLYSSPISNKQIILGKYLSMMIFGVVIITILFIFVLFALFTIENVDFPVILTGLLGLYLLICAYSSIGLFMSGLTHYQVVAAMGTLIVLALLNVVGRTWQHVEFIRDITYWLSIQGRATEMINGMICSEDVVYFILIILFFLTLSLIRLNSKRQKLPFSFTGICYVATILLTLTLGYITSRPQCMFFHDTTRTKKLTLTQSSQEILSKLDGNMTITTYVNVLDKNFFYGAPFMRNMDLDLFKQYRRFRPRIKMKYIYYYDEIANPDLDKRYPNLSLKEKMIQVAGLHKLDTSIIKSPQEIKKIVDLEPEGNRFVRLLELKNGNKTFLRLFEDSQAYANEPEISAAFKRLVMNLPKVGFLHGHGERDCYNKGDRNYSLFTEQKTFRHSLINNGFDFELVGLTKQIPTDIKILIVADIQKPLTEIETQNLNNYIQRGGNLLITGEPKNRDILNPIIKHLGVQLMSGTLVRQSENFEQDFIIGYPTSESGKISYLLENLYNWNRIISMPGSSALEIVEDKGFTTTPIFVTDSTNCWVRENHVNSVLDSLIINPSNGEIEKTYVTMLALNRQINGREQRIIISGDADCISNGELMTSRPNIFTSNYSIINALFFWLSDNEVPVDVRRPQSTDNKVYLTTSNIKTWKIIYTYIFPLILLLTTLIIYFKRKGR